MDLNGDGFSDILSGSYSRMEQPMAGLFQVLWGKADRTFQPAEALKGTDDEPLLIPLERTKTDQSESELLSMSSARGPWPSIGTATATWI